MSLATTASARFKRWVTTPMLVLDTDKDEVLSPAKPGHLP